MHDDAKKVAFVEGKLMQEGLGQEPTAEQIAADPAAKLSVEAIRRVMFVRTTIGRILSLDEPSESDGYEGTKLSDFVQSEDPAVEDEALRNVQGGEAKKILGTFTPNEEKILNLLFGLKDGVPRRELDVAEILGITQQRVSAVRAKVLKRLRDSLR
ncbi:MAG: hypothetical protein HYV37_02825 [Candidatus Levyibacteriota bacterium]|nr:MAG: hypothetical protein HYV37_02825 [Candidatus Levybacteria bacterium]